MQVVDMEVVVTEVMDVVDTDMVVVDMGMEVVDMEDADMDIHCQLEYVEAAAEDKENSPET